MSTGDAARVEQLRLEAGWKKTKSGWRSPAGFTEQAWREAGYPFPEEPLYVDPFSAAALYES